MIASVNTSSFRLPMLRKTNTWYSVCDGNWNDANTWISNGLDKKKHISPQPGDNVYINHIVKVDTSAVVNSLYISGTLKADNAGRVLTVNASMICSGMIDFTGSNITLTLGGVVNQFNTFTAGQSTISYTYSGDYYIPNVAYYNLTMGGTTGTRYQVGDLVVANIFTLPFLSLPGACVFEIGANSLTVNGSMSVGSRWTLSKSQLNGSVLFIGAVTMGSGSNWNFSGNSPMEFRGGLMGTDGTFTSGTGTYSFTTNNQIVGPSNVTLSGNMLLGSGTVVTMTGFLTTFGTVTGASSTSELKINGTHYMYNMSTPMSTGIYTPLNATTSNIGYMFNGNFTIPYASYYGLTVGGSGIKTLGQNTTVSSLTLLKVNGIASTLELSAFNLANSGVTSIGSGCSLSKNSNLGTTLFTGFVSMASGSSWNFSGNPDVEFRGGLMGTDATFNGGSGTYSFTTNSQIIGTGGVTLNGNMIIGANVVITMTGTLTVYGTINGSNAASELNVRNILNLYNAATPMLTGIFTPQGSASSNIGYLFNGNYTLPYGVYYGLTIGGSGIKTLGQNTTVSSLQIVKVNSQNSTLELAAFSFTNSGATGVSSGCLLSKNSNLGATLFTGLVSTSSGSNWNFSGNPDAEFRGGITVGGNSYVWGTGTLKFTTNNQNLAFQGEAIGNILVSGAITVSITGACTVNGTINGDGPNAILVNKTTITYNNAVAPMVTGKLYCNQVANTFIYALAGNQDITTPSDPVSPGYQNLTLKTSGAKRLLGNVSVKGTYTLTSPATLNSNGFSLTNP